VKTFFKAIATTAIGVTLVCSVLLAGQNPVAQTTPAFGQSSVVEGRVFSKDGKPVGGVRVGIMAIPEANAVEGTEALLSLSQTDDEGHYRLENVPPGRYFLVAGSVDVPVYFPGGRKASEATPVVVAGSSILRDRDFHLTSPLTLKVRGRVVGEGKNAITQVTIMSRSVGPANPNPTPALIAPDGTFEFPRVFPGRYEARVQPARNFAPVTLSSMKRTSPTSSCRSLFRRYRTCPLRLPSHWMATGRLHASLCSSNRPTPEPREL